MAPEIMAEFARRWNGGGGWEPLTAGVMADNVPAPLPTDPGAFACTGHGNAAEWQCDFEADGEGSYYALFDVATMRITWIQFNSGD